MPRVETILARGFFVSRAASEFPLFVNRFTIKPANAIILAFMVSLFGALDKW